MPRDILPHNTLASWQMQLGGKTFGLPLLDGCRIICACRLMDARMGVQLTLEELSILKKHPSFILCIFVCQYTLFVI